MDVVSDVEYVFVYQSVRRSHDDVQGVISGTVTHVHAFRVNTRTTIFVSQQRPRCGWSVSDLDLVQTLVFWQIRRTRTIIEYLERDRDVNTEDVHVSSAHGMYVNALRRAVSVRMGVGPSTQFAAIPNVEWMIRRTRFQRDHVTRFRGNHEI
eukprot:Pompholyxophrys_punicea_v1_NODE_913_length_1144_cov_2.570248.p2 type:complete len:152 gc:universal NODE_913_length_1144_cov_2.570248:867-412(-)